MSKIEELIKKHCPNGVEYRTFSLLGEYIRGITYNKSAEVQDDNKEAWNVLRANNITLSSNTLNFDDVKKVSKDIKVKENQLLKENDILICAGSGSKEHIGKVAYIFESIEYTFGGFMGVIRCNNEILNSRFFFHILTSQLFKSHLETNLNSTTINNLNAQIMNCFSIPLPPLPVQEEIVRILDNFTTLEAELQAELEARRKQYEYYRDKLLNVDCRMQNVEWKKLGEIGTFTRGRRFVHADDRDEGIPCIHYGELYTHYGVWADKVKTHINPELTTNFRYADKNDVIIVAAGENNVDIGIGVAWLGNEKVAVHDACFIFKHNQNPKFISYALRTYDYHQQIKSKVSQGKICSISADGLTNAVIPLPSLSEQERIVAILDKFDALVNDISIGLPAEIEARRKQYEYYRNRLLTFN